MSLLGIKDMKFLDKIDYIMEQEDKVLPKGSTKVDLDYTFDENLFDKMANFIINLDPDNLSDQQLEEVLKMIDNLEIEAGELQEKIRLAKKTKLSKNQYSKKWYRANKTEIKRRKEQFKRSGEGRKRASKRTKNAERGKTATGRRKVKYNRRIRSDRK